jgi:translation initiation factor 2 beta subunit (eIF-2beta)/eIF-5
MMRNRSGVHSLPLAILSLVTATATLTYFITKRRQDAKYRKLLYQKYQDEKAEKEVTAKEREAAKEPVGVVTEDIQILKVFVWMCEDLKRRFLSANVVNMMKNKPTLTDIHSPLLRRSSDSKSSQLDELASQGQPYNKLIEDNQVILADIVRKPSMPPHTVGYMRAGICH